MARDVPGFKERMRMIEAAWLSDESRNLPVPPLFGEGFTIGLIEGAHLPESGDP